MQTEVYLCAPLRTPIGKLNGALSSLSAVELGVAAAKGVIERAHIDPTHIQLAIFGNARQAGNGPNIARQISQRAGLPVTSPAYTINMACASGLQSILCAYNEIVTGNHEVVLVGGTESMSNVPYLLPKMRRGYRLGHADILDANFQDGFMCPLCKQLMGETAENLVEKYQISRLEQDQYALLSQSRYEQAFLAGKFQEEIIPIETFINGKRIVVQEDEHPRRGTTLETLSKIPPVFKKDGTVHAGNSSGVTDGAAALLVVSKKKLIELGLEPWARIVASSVCGVEPKYMGLAPISSVQTLIKKTGYSLESIPLIELNEAFAVQVLACVKELSLSPERVNVNGGAISMGHPIGCSGTRIIVTLLHEMKRRDVDLGLATMCVSGGLGLSLLLQRY